MIYGRTLSNRMKTKKKEENEEDGEQEDTRKEKKRGERKETENEDEKRLPIFGEDVMKSHFSANYRPLLLGNFLSFCK